MTEFPLQGDRRFEALVESVTGYGIYLMDVDGHVVSWNRGAEAMKGYSAREIEGRPFAQFFTPEDREDGLPQRLLAVAAQSGRAESEGWRVRKDGSRFWAMATLHALRGDGGEVIGFAKVTRDMTEARAAQDALLESERRFRLLVQGVVDYAIYMLDLDGVVTNWNQGAERIKGYAAEEIVGQHVSRFYTPEDRAAGLPNRGIETAAAEGRFEAEGWRVRKDGTRFWANVVIDAIRDDTGALIGFAKITRDITERRQAENDLRKAQEQIAQAQKMEALGQLTGGVAHDFNNLLMVVSGQAQIIRHRLDEPDRILRAIEAIEMAARRGEDLTRHLLSFSRRQRLEAFVAPVAERLASVGDLVSTSLPATISLTVDLPADLWPVEVDQGELELAILNLAVNARDAMPKGGGLSIAGRNLSRRAAAAEGLDGEFVAITVSDTGVGIPPDILARIFEPFFTTKAVDKGTGLGLSQVFGFAQQAGGDARVQSALGAGAQFTILLPRSTGAPGRIRSWRGVGGAAPPPSATILVVEDNPDVAEVAVGLVEQLGHRVRFVNSAEAALAALAEGDPPAMVFSDIVMAGDLDGLGLAQRIRERHPTLPVLLATGYSLAAEGIADEFPILRKPYSLDDLADWIAVLLQPADSADVAPEAG